MYLTGMNVGQLCEEEKYLSNIIPENTVVVVDCVTLWITNFYTDSKYDIEKSLLLIKEELIKRSKYNLNYYF